MKTGEIIQQHRKRLGLSQEELGSMLSLSRQTVSQWENGITVPSVDNLIRMRDIFGITVDEMLGFPEEITEETVTPTNEGKPSSEDYFFTFTKEEIVKLNRREKLKFLSVNGLIIAFLLTLCFGNFYIRNADGTYHTFSLSFFFILVAIGYSAAVIKKYSDIRKVLRERVEKLSTGEYSYSFFYDHFICEVTRDGSLSMQQKIFFKDIKKIIVYDNYIFVVTSPFLLFLRKNELQPDGFFMRYVEETSKTKISTKKATAYRTVSVILFILSLLSLHLAMISLSLLFERTGDILNPIEMFNNLWIFFAFIPIPLSSIIFGIFLKKKKLKYAKNIVIGVIMTFLLTIFGLICLIPSAVSDTGSDSAELFNKAERIAGIDFPEYESISVIDERNGGTINAQRGDIKAITRVKFGTRQARSVYRALLYDKAWRGYVPTELVGITSSFCDNTKDVFILIYNNDTGEINSLPEKEGEYNYINILYFHNQSIMTIVDYDIKYIASPLEISAQDENAFLSYDAPLAIGHTAISYSPEITKNEISIISRLMPVEYTESGAEEIFREKTPDVYIHVKNDSSVCWEFFKHENNVYVKNPDGAYGKAHSTVIDKIEEIYMGKF